MANSIEFDLDGQHRPNAYPILASLVTPRPIAWVTTVDAEGNVNAAPFSFFNVFGSNPPIVAFAPGNKEPGLPKDTAKNVRQSREFVINLVDQPVAEAMVATSASLPYGTSELDGLGLSLSKSSVVAPPRISEAPAALECREYTTMEIGTNRLVIGTVHRVHAREGLFDPESLRFDQANYHPVGRMASPDWYCLTDQLFNIEHP
ncbi:NADH-FMN oxidoreductase RutF, flavin reductase (DIM6/NTAB) family [Rubritalea squalenifaciens DSM 18772]|uniref:NADH-FMN oxidoreductase RutF, flavin reductase (DIM6/NTAB) family n=1 Tax=Rubritalea squalenifaciens DSM 18772 TaxID=1123071 RepID=A0A1M6DVM8_9BACT|nr:flavin reductase family protein [Rubritalea squalenifaciens]SHI77078.1 NADH-FMN oxidoreductase RutF, flavin reductase (DIM6/NTAB) family [Rubritalea squalenifaciens DSM 18772]